MTLSWLFLGVPWPASKKQGTQEHRAGVWGHSSELRVMGHRDMGGPHQILTPHLGSHLSHCCLPCTDTTFNYYFLLKYCYTQRNAAAILVQGGITKQPCLHLKYLR